jgi:hypothetical protein
MLDLLRKIRKRPAPRQFSFPGVTAPWRSRLSFRKKANQPVRAHPGLVSFRYLAPDRYPAKLASSENNRASHAPRAWQVLAKWGPIGVHLRSSAAIFISWGDCASSQGFRFVKKAISQSGRFSDWLRFAT